MLCCVPKRLADGGGPFRDENTFRDAAFLLHGEALFRDDEVANASRSVRQIRIELYPEEDAPPPFLLPCAICARTFTPQSLEKHARICERAAAKKRKPFDSAKQRIQGTELAEFLPKQETRRHHHQTERPAVRSSWKKTHDDFLRTIREARGEVMDDSHKQYNSLITSGAPTRANEKGMCPTCNRQFGIKAYDRHVAWCKERVTRMPLSPATNLAKERLEARMRYRAPALKNRRAINREKYSPSSMANQSAKISVSSPALIKTKESVPVANTNRESPVKQKPAIVRRPRQLKESLTSSGPIKSRLADRANRPMEDHDNVLTSYRSSHLAISSRRALHFSVPPARSRVNDPVISNEIASPIASSKQFDRNKTISQRIRSNDEARNREVHFAKTRRNIVFARSQGHPRINDTDMNNKIPGMIVQPCRIRTDTQKDYQLVTWKQISRKKDNIQVNDSVVSLDFSHEFQLFDRDRQCDEKEVKDKKIKRDSFVTNDDFIRIDELKDVEADQTRNDNVVWLNNIQDLNQTYLIRDSENIESAEMLHGKWRSIEHSPRAEFYLKRREDEIYQLDNKKSRREGITNDEEITVRRGKELEMNIETKEIDEIKVTSHRKKSNIDSEDKKDYWKACDKKTKMIERELEELNIDMENKDNNRKSIDEEEITERNIKKVEINIENEKEIQKMYNENLVKMDELNMAEKDRIDRPITIDKKIIGIVKHPEIKEIEQNLSDRDVKSPMFDVMHPTPRNVPKKYVKSTFKETKTISANNDDYVILDKESSNSQHKNLILHLDNKDNLVFSDSFIDQDYSNFKDETLEYKTDTYRDNLLHLKQSATTLTSDRSDRNNVFLNSNQINRCLSPEYNVLSCENNIHLNSLNQTENIEISSPVTCRIVNPKRNFAENIEEIDINKKRQEKGKDLITCHDKESFNSEVLLPQDSKNVTDNYLNAHTSNVSLRIRANERDSEDFFDSNNLEIMEDDMINGKTDVYADLDSCSNDKSRLVNRSIIKTDVATGEGSRMKNARSEYDYGSDSNAYVGERNARDANDLRSSLKGDVDALGCCCRETTYSDPSVNLSKRAPDSIGRIVKERSANSIEMRRRIRENMDLLRDSTDSLISSTEYVKLSNIKRPDANCTYERETIEIITPNRRVGRSKGLPGIKNDLTRTRENSKRSYWERVSKISRSELIGVDVSRHANYKLVKRIPRVRNLSSVPHPSFTILRKFDLATRPAWCNYVRRRPDFNLVLKARTGACKDYDPFLRAEQQMNDLLSDTSDQSTIQGSPKLQSTRDTLYPLSHSSAFVKYPPADKRSSLIAPPFEFDDLGSEFSSDSTETNSISREVFLKPDLASKDTTTELAGSRPVKELGRRMIIDKSKALGVDEHQRRAVIGSADRPRKIFDKFTPKVTRPLIDRSDSIRASSASRINSDAERKASGDVGRARGNKIAECQRSSDQCLNQRNNNNYSSMSGSNLSLSSIVSSSEPDVKRSNSMFDELLTSFEEDAFPDLRSFLNNESFDLFSPGGDRQRNGSLISDEELSSPDSYKPQDHSKISNDSAYSSLNRKYSHDGRSTNDVISRLDEDPPRNGTSPTQTTIRCKMSKFCHECGQRFPETAKFCCECGVRRLAL